MVLPALRGPQSAQKVRKQSPALRMIPARRLSVAGLWSGGLRLNNYPRSIR